MHAECMHVYMYTALLLPFRHTYTGMYMHLQLKYTRVEALMQGLHMSWKLERSLLLARRIGLRASVLLAWRMACEQLGCCVYMSAHSAFICLMRFETAC